MTLGNGIYLSGLPAYHSQYALNAPRSAVLRITWGNDDLQASLHFHQQSYNDIRYSPTFTNTTSNMYNAVEIYLQFIIKENLIILKSPENFYPQTFNSGEEILFQSDLRIIFTILYGEFSNRQWEN
uniref:Uncharacterized protein n=1 Tax=Glossina pallidipes TaxID=7398 RepID=A0A1B0ADG4_GLOPL